MSDLYDIATSAMTAQRERMDVIAGNLANAGVVRADHKVFSASDAVLENGTSFSAQLEQAFVDPSIPMFNEAFFDEPAAFIGTAQDSAKPQTIGVQLVPDSRPARLQYEPGNPFAQTSGPHKGYVVTPDIDPIAQMIGLVSAGRAYDADVSMLQTAKQMDLEAADIARG